MSICNCSVLLSGKNGFEIKYCNIHSMVDEIRDLSLALLEQIKKSDFTDELGHPLIMNDSFIKLNKLMTEKCLYCGEEVSKFGHNKCLEYAEDNYFK